MKILPSFDNDELKEIGEELAEVIRIHGLQNSPQKCRELFSYMSDVVDGWNCINWHSNCQ